MRSGVLDNLTDGVGKADGVAKLPGPVLGVCDFGGGDPFAGQRGDVRNRRRGEGDAANDFSELEPGRLDHAAVEGVRSSELAMDDLLGVQPLDEGVDGRVAARRPRRVAGC